MLKGLILKIIDRGGNGHFRISKLEEQNHCSLSQAATQKIIKQFVKYFQ